MALISDKWQVGMITDKEVEHLWKSKTMRAASHLDMVSTSWTFTNSFIVIPTQLGDNKFVKPFNIKTINTLFTFKLFPILLC